MGQSMSSSSEPSEPLLLSSLLKAGKVKDVEKESRVKLPGVDLESYSGYITVDAEQDKNLFFWFFPAKEAEPTEAPLLVYLDGGPGFSSLTGVFTELGPLRVDKDAKVRKAESTWTDNFNVIYVDNPVFVGFSYAKPGHESNNMRTIANDLFSFLTQFLKLYPKYQPCDLYIGGLSYAGKYVASVASKIQTEAEEENLKVPMNLKGIYVFSGFFDPYQMYHNYPNFLLSLGLISEKKARNLSEKLAYALDKHRLLGKHEEAIMDVLDAVFNQMHITLGFESINNALDTKQEEWHMEKYLNKPEIQRAIHARACQYTVFVQTTIVHMAEDFMNGVPLELKNVLEHYKVLLVSGQMDLLVSVPMMESFLHDFRWSGMSRYLVADKTIWRDANGEVAGYVTEVKNLTRVVMRNAGHRIAHDQPQWTLEMMDKFVGDHSFAH